VHDPQALHRAAAKSAKCTELLLQHKASTTICDIDSFTLLHHAAQASHLKPGKAWQIIKLLVKEGKVPVNGLDCMQATPLHITTYKGCIRYSDTHHWQ